MAPDQTSAVRKDYRLVYLMYLLAILKFILPFLIQDHSYEPHRDEFLYLAEGRHMAFGFMEVPPMLSIFAWFTNLLGGGFFWVKFWPSMLGSLTYLLLGRLILSFGGKWFALTLAFLPFVFGAYLRVFYLFQPNCPEIFFWTLMAYGLVRHVQTGSNRGLYIAGIAFGLGMLSKYSVSFYAISLCGGLILTKERRILGNRHFYFAFLIGLLIFLPNFLWQYVHGFPVVYHMKELQEKQLQYISPIAFLIGQLLFNMPCFFTWMTGLGFVSFAKRGRSYRFIGWAFLFVMIILLLGHGKDYYALGTYPILIAFGSLALERWASGARYFMRFALIGFTFLLGYTFITIALPFLPPPALAAHYAKSGIAKKSGALHWEDLKDHPLPQDFADMLSWKEMTAKAAKAYGMLDSAEKTRTLLFCDNYGEAGAVNWYGPAYHLPSFYSDNASFLYWMPEKYPMDNLVLLTDDQQEMQHSFIKEFASATVIDSITNPFAREYGALIILLKGSSETFKSAFREKIEKAKYKATAAGAQSSGLSPNPLEKGGTLH